MSGHRPFSELLKDLSSERLKAIEEESAPLNAEFLEENPVAHLGVSQDLIPTDYLDIKVDIIHPLKPTKSVRHRFEILFTLKPLLYLRC